MAHGIDPAIDQMKSAALEPAPDRPPSDPRGKQLAAANDAVLHVRQLGKHSIDMYVCEVQPMSFTFCPCQGLNVKLVLGRGFD